MHDGVYAGLVDLQKGASPDIIAQPLPDDATVAIAVGADPEAEVKGAADGVPLNTEAAESESTATNTDGDKPAAAQIAASAGVPVPMCP